MVSLHHTHATEYMLRELIEEVCREEYAKRPGSDVHLEQRMLGLI